MARAADGDVVRLQGLVQTFVRRFGLLVTKETPCGQPVSPSYAHALMLLLQRERVGETTAQAELVELLGLDKSSVARLSARLEAAGHATQARAPDDGRSRWLALTPRGRQMASNILAASQARFRRVASAVPRAQRRALLESLQVLNDAVAALEEPSS